MSEKTVPVPYHKVATIEHRANIFSNHMQEFMRGTDGQLIHLTDGVHRSTVPPDGFSDYAEAWPDARHVIAYIKSGAKTVAAVSTNPKVQAEASILSAALDALTGMADGTGMVETTPSPKKPKKAKKR